MAIATVLDPIEKGEPVTDSATVETGNVVRGMALKRSSNGKVAPATAGTRVIGIALYDAIIGEEVTYALTMSGGFTARMLLTESQTITAGDPLCAGSITISGVTTNGLLTKQTDAVIADITDTFTDWTIATHDDAKINAAANGLIDELDTLVGNLSDMVTEVGGIITQAQSFVGFAMESITTTTDEGAVIKVYVCGPSL